jgi:glycosyltransferase involved in cell wall biosynthesis
MESKLGKSELISIVVPLLNESESLEELGNALLTVAATHGLYLEVIFVDDGSRDGSWDKIRRLATAEPRIRGIRFRRNFGKAAALAAGFDAALGQVVLQMDADLQDDPAEIPRFLAKLEEGFDVVNGWKRVRKDPWHRVWPSRVFNWLVSCLTGLKLHDHNCGLKCFRAEVVKELPLYGELHRFIPVMAHARGYRVAELPVVHHPRRYGRSKYRFHRFVKGFLDLLSVVFLTVFGERPLHLLGGIGLPAFLLGAAGLSYLAVCWVLARFRVHGFGPIGTRPLLIYSLACLIIGFQMLAIGFLGELVASQNMRNEHKYSIAELTPPTRGNGR